MISDMSLSSLLPDPLLVKKAASRRLIRSLSNWFHNVAVSIDGLWYLGNGDFQNEPPVFFQNRFYFCGIIGACLGAHFFPYEVVSVTFYLSAQ